MSKNNALVGKMKAVIGPHLVREEAPDTFFIRLQGDVSGEDVRQMYDHFETFHRGKKFVFTLVDVAELGSLTPGARKMAVRDPRAEIGDGVAIYGASLGARVLFQLLFKAAAMLVPNGDHTMQICTTESEARTFLRKRRSMLDSDTDLAER